MPVGDTHHLTTKYHSQKPAKKHSILFTKVLAMLRFYPLHMSLQAETLAKQQHPPQLPSCGNQMLRWNHWHIQKSTGQNWVPQPVLYSAEFLFEILWHLSTPGDLFLLLQRKLRHLVQPQQRAASLPRKGKEQPPTDANGG